MSLDSSHVFFALAFQIFIASGDGKNSAFYGPHKNTFVDIIKGFYPNTVAI